MKSATRFIPARKARDTATIRWASNVKPENVRWAWKDRIPLGSLTLIVGAPGQGKSTLVCDLAARWSQGKAEGDLAGECSPVLIASAEDDWASVLRPRLETAGADLRRVGFVEVVSLRGTRGLRFPQDLSILRKRMKATRARVLILDPLFAYIDPKFNSWRDHDVRILLTALGHLAEELGVAVVSIVHLNKSRSRDFLTRVSGSVGIVAAARSVLFVAPDPSDPGGPNRILAHGKTNFAPPAHPVRFRVEPRMVTTESSDRIATSGITYLGEATGISASDLLEGPHSSEDLSQLNEAQGILEQILAEGPVTVREVFRQAREAGISDRTLRRAKDHLKVVSTKEGFAAQGVWYWSLAKETPSQPKEGHSAKPGNVRPRARREGPPNATALKDGQRRQDGQLSATPSVRTSGSARSSGRRGFSEGLKQPKPAAISRR